MKNKLMLIILAATLMLNFCSDSLTEKNYNRLSADGSWKLEFINNKKPIEGSTITLKLNEDNVHGFAGCNGYSGHFDLSKNTIRFKEVIITTKACMNIPGVMDQESRYVKALDSVRFYKLENSKLHLKDVQNQTVLLFRFEAKKVVNYPLENTLWQVNSFIEGEMAQSVVKGQKFSLQFIDGKISGSSICNKFSGTYEMDGEAIAIKLDEKVYKPCPESYQNQQETQFFKIINNSKSFKLKEKFLTIWAENGKAVELRALQ